MQFPFDPVTDLDDVTKNFETIQTEFGFPVFTAAPSNPRPGQAYYDSTLGKLGYWNGVLASWTYV